MAATAARAAAATPATETAPSYGSLALFSLCRRVRMDHYTPEDYAAAGGELLVLALISSWVITYFFNPAVIEKNRLKDVVGYNNLCVGWDSFPARMVAAPLFALIIYLYIQFMNLDTLRQNLETGLTMRERSITYFCNLLTGLSYCVACLIFVFDPMYYPLAHSASFVQLIFFGYFAYAANFYETDRRYHPKGSYVYLAVFGIASVTFSVMAVYMLIVFDPKTGVRGAIPWYVIAACDYMWFFCKALGSVFRPAAPSIRVSYELVSNENFTVLPGMTRDTPENFFSKGVGNVE
mmetsp:Transcript_138091/g.429235  ORF Transcript_138091/g.429235 Transcript_138091/m.429235 type:complete len:293 (+) Transcript_138091:2-880(+)